MSGVFPVTALMTRQATDVLWLSPENSAGETTRMGVTSEHPLFAAGEGWLKAGELVAGDVVRDSSLQALRVLAVELDTAPQRVHNLEVAVTHTYFAGELEAWGHNVTLKDLPPPIKNVAHALKGKDYCNLPDPKNQFDFKIDADTGNIWVTPNQKNNKGGFKSYDSGFNVCELAELLNPKKSKKKKRRRR